jgi:tetratricopeptide (TPR) repeat protein
MPVDLDALWDFDDPAGSEARLTDALTRATGDDALVLLTQIARTRSLRRLTADARDTLVPVGAALPSAGPDAAARYWLELGRTWISAVTTPGERTPDALASAREAYLRAIDVASEAGLDALAIDAIHMMAFVDTDPADQLAWNARGLEIARASDDPAARRWEASLRNNLGMALHGAGRDDEALEQFEAALDLRLAEGDAGRIAIARWMVAFALRHLGRTGEAVEIQLRLERELDAAGTPDPYVFEELEVLYRALGDEAQAAHYARRLAASREEAGPG